MYHINLNVERKVLGQITVSIIFRFVNPPPPDPPSDPTLSVDGARDQAQKTNPDLATMGERRVRKTNQKPREMQPGEAKPKQHNRRAKCHGPGKASPKASMYQASEPGPNDGALERARALPTTAAH